MSAHCREGSRKQSASSPRNRQFLESTGHSPGIQKDFEKPKTKKRKTDNHSSRTSEVAYESVRLPHVSPVLCGMAQVFYICSGCRSGSSLRVLPFFCGISAVSSGSGPLAFYAPEKAGKKEAGGAPAAVPGGDSRSFLGPGVGVFRRECLCGESSGPAGV